MDNNSKTTGGRVLTIVICYAVTLFIVLVLPGKAGVFLALLCIYFGWIALNRIQIVYFL